jgi:hypothetical protein
MYILLYGNIMAQLIITRSGANLKKYFYNDGDKELGPYTYEELKQAGITKETLVWFEGQEKWMKAGLIDELKGLFRPASSTDENYTSEEQERLMRLQQEESKNMKRRLILRLTGVVLVLIFISLLVILFAVYRGHLHKSQAAKKDGSILTGIARRTDVPAEFMPFVLQEEQKEPSKYLVVDYSLKFGMHSGKDIIKGHIYNFARLVKYKDINLIVDYSAKGGKNIKTENFIINDSVGPASSVSFTIKTYSPDGTKRIGVKVAGATYLTKQ